MSASRIRTAVCCTLLSLLAGRDLSADSPATTIDVSRLGVTNRVDLSWAADGGVFYDIECSTNLTAGSWLNLTADAPVAVTNVIGTLNLLEMAKTHKIPKFVLASTSSLYAGQPMPFQETLAVNTPISPYAASKKGAEAVCYSYHHLYGIDVSIVRYFTVYGPAGRPDMSVFIFTKKIDEGIPMDVFGNGSQSRDFTYVDDIAKGTIKAIKNVGFKVINLGGSDPYKLSDMIQLVEKYLGKKAIINYKPFHKADIMATWADTREAKKTLGWTPTVSLEEGIKRTVTWYQENRTWIKKIKVG
jgi:nucleoside-diphosphate-sugar epimerase